MTTTSTTPAAGVDHPVAHALVDALTLLRPVADPGEIRLWQLGDDQCLTTMLTVQHVESVVAAIKLQLLGVMEERQVTQHATNLGTAAWLNGTTASSLQAAYRETGLARGLHRRFPAIVTAMAAGAVSAEQADAIVRVLKKLPENLSVEQLQAAEAMMIGFAADHGPKGLRDLARHLLNVIAPEIAETTEAAALEAQDREARKNQYLRLRDDGDGAVTIAGKLPAADGEAHLAVVDAIATSSKTGDGSWSEPGLSYEARRAQALMTLVHAYHAGGHGPRHGGDRPRVTVLVNYEDLLRGVAGATLLGSNTRISQRSPSARLRRRHPPRRHEERLTDPRPRPHHPTLRR